MDRRKFLKLACAGVPALGALSATTVRAGGKGPRYAMVIDLRRCVGCHSCSVSCSVENRVPVGKFRATVGEFVVEDKGVAPTVAPLPRLCNHCEEPACLPVCPVHATYKDENGPVLVDSDKCLACGFCVQACPYDARYINPVTHTTDKCTFCVHRLQAGLLPACVENCVGGARIFGDLNDPESLVSRTLKAYRGEISVLAPEKGTKPNVYYINLNAFLDSPANVGLPMAEGAMTAEVNMPEVIELVNVPPTITREILEPLALTLLTAAACAILLAGGLALAGHGRKTRLGLFTTGIASAITGPGALTLSPGNPFHLYMFMVSPSFSSWTTIGTFLLPVFLCLSLLALYLDSNGDGRVRFVAGLAILFAPGVLTYASREIGYLQGRVMWHSKALPLGFVLAGLSGGIGLAALLAALKRRPMHSWLILLMSGASLLCAGAGFMLTPPEGYVLEAPAAWTTLSLIGAAGGVLGLISLKARGLAPLAGLAAYGAGLGFYIRLIFLGQSIPRNSYTAVDAQAVAHLVSAQSLLILAGSLVFLLGIGMVLGGLFSNVGMARREHSHG